MPKDTIKCPNCGKVIKISEAIADEIEGHLREDYEKEKAKWREGELKKAEEKARREAEGAANEKLAAVEEKLARERRTIDAERKKAEESMQREVSDLKAQVDEKAAQLKKAEDAELDLRKKQREIEDRERKMELEMQRKLDEERGRIRQVAQEEFEDSHKLKLAEKDKMLDDMKRRLEDMKRKAEQGSQQTQGEVLELELEGMFRAKFPFDEIEAVSKGVRGGDVIQTVKTQSGKVCGKILWETKRTKAWSDGWIQKVKDDRRDAKADIAVIVSETLPEGFRHFRQVKDVWVTDVPTTMSLAIALRMILIQVARTKDTQTGKEEKMEIVYNYLTGAEFKNRVQAIMEGFVSLRHDVEAERRAMEKIWAKREKQIDRVVLNIAGMRGDLEGIVGKTLPTIKILELPEGED